MAIVYNVTRIVFLFLVIFLNLSAGAQTFKSSQTIPIPQLGTVSYPVIVSGLSANMDTTVFGLQSISINIEHSDNRDLTIYLQSPDGTTALLLKKLPGTNFLNTILSGEADRYIDFGKSPYNQNFRPIQDLALLNNSSNPNGEWKLIVVDDSTGGTGTIRGVSLQFGNNPAKPILSSSDLPIVIINTHGEEIGNSSKLLSDMKIIYNGAGQWNYINGTNYHYEGKIAIKIRGNSSQRYPKKQYGFDTMNEDGSDDIKVSLLGMPKESDWILSAIYQDKTMMRNPLTYQLSNEMGNYAVRTQYCELIINNEYRGVFVFQEKIKRDKNRVNIEKIDVNDVTEPGITGGYMFKLDNIDSDEIFWRSKLPDTTGWRRAFVYVYPKKPEDINTQQRQYIEGYVDAFEKSLLKDNFTDPVDGFRNYIDEASFIDFFIINELSNNIDAYRKSAYFHKGRGGKIMAGPVWDYDLAWGNANYFGGNSSTGYRYSYQYPSDDYRVPFWWSRMMEDPLWKQNMVCRYRELRSTILSLDHLYGIVDSLYGAINHAQERNFIRWKILGQYVPANPTPIPPTYSAEVANLKRIIKERLDFLDADLPMCPTQVLLPPLNPGNLLEGLNYKYYESTDYSAIPDFTKVDPVFTSITNNFNVSVSKRKERFALHFEGYIDIQKDGVYSFYTSSDDGSILYIDNIKVVDNDGLHSLREVSGEIGLQAGKHKISVEYFQRDWDGILNVKYSGPDLVKQNIPDVLLYRTNTVELIPSLNPSNAIGGLNFEYYEFADIKQIPDFSNLSPKTKGATPGFDLSVANRQSQMAIRFDGYVDIPADGFYTFYTSSDDGSLLYIDNRLVVNNDGLHPLRERSGVIGLKAGKHRISVDFFQASGGQTLLVSYSGELLSKRQIPTSALSRDQSGELLPATVVENPENGLYYKYYEASSYDRLPDFSRAEALKEGGVLDFDISAASRSQSFAMQFNGYLDIPVDGYYTFYTSSDDGSALYVDGKLIVDNDGLHPMRERSGTVGLAKGKHYLRVDFFQAAGGRSLAVNYSGSTFAKKPIPLSDLYRTKTEELLPAVATGMIEQGLKYKYFESSSYEILPDFSESVPVKKGVVPAFDISVAARSNSFAIQFDGYIDIPTDGYYTFYTSSDDGSNLLIDDRYIVENNGLHPLRERSGVVGLKAGKHRISVGFFQEGGGKTLNVYFSGPGVTKRIVPASILYSDLPTATSAKHSSKSNLLDRNPDEEIQVQAYPNPFANLLTVDLTGDEGWYMLDLIDINGKLLLSRSGSKFKGSQMEALNVAKVVKGTYFIRIYYNNKVRTIKVVKK